jgi:hypothetical protein
VSGVVGVAQVEDRNVRSVEPVGGKSSVQVIWERLENQISWYASKSEQAQRWFTRLKLVEIIIAASLLVVTGFFSSVWLRGALAVAIVILESMQYLYRYQEHWIIYRSTCEALRHESLFVPSPCRPRQISTRPRYLARREHRELSVTGAY